MSDALSTLRRELAQIEDLVIAARVLEWDQLVMMPRRGRRPRREARDGQPVRARAVLRDEIGELLERAAPGRGRPRSGLRRGMADRRDAARLGEGAADPAGAARRDDEGGLGRDGGLGGRAGEGRLRELPAVARPYARAQAPVHRVLPRHGRALRPAAGRLRAGHADRRGAPRVRAARPALRELLASATDEEDEPFSPGRTRGRHSTSSRSPSPAPSARPRAASASTPPSIPSASRSRRGTSV